MKNIAIICHDADFDGKLSNETCRHWLKKLHPEANIHSYGWDYGRPVPTPLLREFDPAFGDQFSNKWTDYDLIYIVDLSVDELMAKPELLEKIVWIDHHKSAIEKWDKLADIGDKPFPYFTGYRIDGVAACRLCWQWFLVNELNLTEGGIGRFDHPTKRDFIDRKVSEPELIRLAGEYDIWDHRDPDAKALQFGLRTFEPHEFRMLVAEQFEHLLGINLLGEAIAKGHAIKTYCDKQNDEYSRDFSQTIKWEGFTFCALNIGQRGNSDLLRGGIKPDHQALFAWRHVGDSPNPVYVSLYHAPGHEDIDLSLIATKYGGGGHRGACGFRTTLSKLAEIIG